MLNDDYEKENGFNEMTLRGIWILNYATTVSLIAFLSLSLLQRVNLDESDKDIVIVYFVAFAGLYLFFLTHLFYQRIYKWKTKRRGPYFILISVTVVLSFIILLTIFTAGEHFTIRLTLISVLCGLNIVTYFWGLQGKQTTD